MNISVQKAGFEYEDNNEHPTIKNTNSIKTNSNTFTSSHNTNEEEKIKNEVSPIRGKKCILVQTQLPSLETFLLEKHHSNIQRINNTMTPIIKTHLSRNISTTPQQIFKTTFLHQMGHQFELIHQNNKKKKEDKSIFDDQSIKCSLFRNRNDVIVTDRIISQSKYLELRDEVGSLLNGNKVIVNASGIEGGLRQKRNGVSVFGVDNGKGNIDYAVNMKYDLSKKNNILFQIEFDEKTLKYYLKKTKNNVDNILFIKVNKRLYIGKKKIRIVINKELFTFYQDLNSGILLEKRFNKETQTEESLFHSQNELIQSNQDEETKKIFFSINKEDWYLSFSPEKLSWYIDRDYAVGYSSCWQVLDEPIELSHSNYVKVSKDIIKIILKDNKNSNVYMDK